MMFLCQKDFYSSFSKPLVELLQATNKLSFTFSVHNFTGRNYPVLVIIVHGRNKYFSGKKRDFKDKFQTCNSAVATVLQVFSKEYILKGR